MEPARPRPELRPRGWEEGPDGGVPAEVRGRATGLVAGSSKFGGIAVQVAAMAKMFPTLGGAALALLPPTVLCVVMLATSGREVPKGRSG